MILTIDGEYDDWVQLNKIDLKATIADNVKVVSCDTRDFALGWQFEYPKEVEKPECGLDYRENEGLKKLSELKYAKNTDPFMIGSSEILEWLDNLCKRTGGYDKDWRSLIAGVDYCRNWEIKYIRFVRNPKDTNRFIVCNSYFRPIHWRKIIDNLKMDLL